MSIAFIILSLIWKKNKLLIRFLFAHIFSFSLIIRFGLLAVFECVFIGADSFSVMSFPKLTAAGHARFYIGAAGTSRSARFTENTNQCSNRNADNEEVKNAISSFLFFHGANQLIARY